ncbi:MAG: hypothetical protein KKF44_06505 [Nanoarchaeota archaeon]|nr:hypothetical protein [Nanoarchaeota archaeon]
MRKILILLLVLISFVLFTGCTNKSETIKICDMNAYCRLSDSGDQCERTYAFNYYLHDSDESLEPEECRIPWTTMKKCCIPSEWKEKAACPVEWDTELVCREGVGNFPFSCGVEEYACFYDGDPKCCPLSGWGWTPQCPEEWDTDEICSDGVQSFPFGCPYEEYKCFEGGKPMCCHATEWIDDNQCPKEWLDEEYCREGSEDYPFGCLPIEYTCFDDETPQCCFINEDHYCETVFESSCGLNFFVDCYWDKNLEKCVSNEKIIEENKDIQYSDANGMITDVIMGVWYDDMGVLLNSIALIIANLETARVHLLVGKPFGSEGDNVNVQKDVSNYIELMKLLKIYGADNELKVYEMSFGGEAWLRNHFTVQMTFASNDERIQSNIYYAPSNPDPLPYVVMDTIEESIGEGFSFQQSDFLLAGGNVIQSKNHAFLNNLEIFPNQFFYSFTDEQYDLNNRIDAGELDMERKDLVSESDIEYAEKMLSTLNGYYNKEIGIIDYNEFYPYIYHAPSHIDMRMQYIGNNRFIVGDIKIAKEIVDEVQNTNPKLLIEWEDYIYSAYGIELNDNLKGKYIVTLANEAIKWQDESDKITEQIEQLGYSVFRVPYLPSSREVMKKGYQEKSPQFVYVNGLIMFDENPNDDKTFTPRVLMPTFDFEPLDTKATEVYKSLGFDVREIPSVAWSLNGGAVYCLTQDIGRDISPSEDMIDLYESSKPIDKVLINAQINRLNDIETRFITSSVLSSVALS